MKMVLKCPILRASGIFFELPLAKVVKTTLILWQFLRQLNSP